MDRRNFIKKSVGAGIVLGSSLSLLGNRNLFGNTVPASENFDLIAIKGGEADVMFDKAIAEFGGIKKFVKKGQTVVVKPNIGWDVVPENAANTNPLLVKRVIEHCYNAGAKTVYVFDHTCDNWTKCYKNSGIEKAVNDAGGKIVSGDKESYYQDVDIPSGKKLKKDKVHELILQSDVFINLPVLKHHFAGRITIAMKNLMGIVWDRGEWHRNDLHQCIADFATYRKPDLNIIDAYAVMKKNGPRGVSREDVVLLKSQIISTDIVAADAAATKLFGMEPDEVNYIRFADEMKVGKKDLDKLSIKRLKI
jgi:uncharacterized protein (DUF362 family)